MTEKERYNLIKDYTSIFKHKQGIISGVHDIEKSKEMNFKEVVELLNKQDKQIFYLQTLLMNIDAEIQEKRMTKERFKEIKDDLYYRFYGKK